MIVLEKTPRWAPALRFEFETERTAVHECRNLADLEQRLNGFEVSAAFPATVVIDAAMVGEDVLTWIGRHPGETRPWDVIVLATEEVSKNEWGLRELGVVAVIPDSVTTSHLAVVCRRLETGLRNRNLTVQC